MFYNYYILIYIFNLLIYNSADLIVDKIKVAYCENDGNGGNTFISAYPNQQALLNKVAAYAKTLPPIEFAGSKINSDLELVVDGLVDDYFNKKEKASFEKKIEKSTLENVVFGNPDEGSYKQRGFNNTKGKRISIEALKTIPNGKQALEKLIAEIKSNLAPGEIIINKNLKEFGI